MIDAGSVCKKRAVATEVLDIVSDRNVNDKREREREKKQRQRECEKKRKQRELKRKRETVEQEMARLHSERTRLRTMRQKKQALETEGEKDTRMCLESEQLVNFRR